MVSSIFISNNTLRDNSCDSILVLVAQTLWSSLSLLELRGEPTSYVSIDQHMVNGVLINK